MYTVPDSKKPGSREQGRSLIDLPFAKDQHQCSYCKEDAPGDICDSVYPPVPRIPFVPAVRASREPVAACIGAHSPLQSFDPRLETLLLIAYLAVVSKCLHRVLGGCVAWELLLKIGKLP